IHRGVVHPQRGSMSVEQFESRQCYDPQRGVVPGATFFYPSTQEPPVREGDVINMISTTEAIFWSFPEAEPYFPGESTNVFRLCEEYFVNLKMLVHEWLAVRECLG